MKHKKLNSLTFGAMVCALVGALLLVNRLLAGVLDVYLFWIIPLPVIIYVLKFGVRDSAIMGIAMVLLSFIVATPVTVFYVAIAFLAGLVYGAGVLANHSALRLICSVILVSLVSMVITTFVAGGVFGYDIGEEIAWLNQVVTQYFASVQQAAASSGQTVTVPSLFTSNNFLLTILVISLVLSSILEGILVHLLALLVLKKLKMPLPANKPISEIVCPTWLKVYVFACFVANITATITQITKYDEILMPLVIIACVIAEFFGYILFLTWLSVKVPDKRKRTPMVILMLVVFILFNPLLIVLGGIDIFTSVRKRLLERRVTDERRDGSL